MNQEREILISEKTVKNLLTQVLNYLSENQTMLTFSSYSSIEINKIGSIKKTEELFYFDSGNNLVYKVVFLDKEISMKKDSEDAFVVPKNKWEFLEKSVHKMISGGSDQHQKKRVQKVVNQLNVLRFKIKSGLLYSHEYTMVVK